MLTISLADRTVWQWNTCRPDFLEVQARRAFSSSIDCHLWPGPQLAFCKCRGVVAVCSFLIYGRSVIGEQTAGRRRLGFLITPGFIEISDFSRQRGGCSRRALS